MNSFKDICKENYMRIYKYVFFTIKDKSCAEDITQEVFIIAYQKGKKFIKHDNPSAFLYKTAKNLVCEEIRRRKKQKNVELIDEIIGHDDVWENIDKEKDDEIDETEYINIVINELSEEKRNLYLDYYVKHKTMKEISKERNINETAIRMRFVRMRKEIKTIINKLKFSEI